MSSTPGPVKLMTLGTATHIQRVVYSWLEPLSSSTISALQGRITLELYSQGV
ncbi:hypothetical protein BOTBODRAFT_338078 [Botryobasidium botryosum FD-172 SS1]|uniref:Uncharacterized protein n=1 Tax=Botryobasidium botryosum (strain FD-172 SS1) TaxID=930990 RepID=A0A067MSV2_BOTB1|nr:hypothetical protein BOTBODRAFT_338078 [Botryobasidium botryosum FD-172 SS1]